jgi:hypothetical protein
VFLGAKQIQHTRYCNLVSSSISALLRNVGHFIAIPGCSIGLVTVSSVVMVSHRTQPSLIVADAIWQVFFPRLGVLTQSLIFHSSRCFSKVGFASSSTFDLGQLPLVPFTRALLCPVCARVYVHSGTQEKAEKRGKAQLRPLPLRRIMTTCPTRLHWRARYMTWTRDISGAFLSPEMARAAARSS